MAPAILTYTKPIHAPCSHQFPTTDSSHYITYWHSTFTSHETIRRTIIVENYTVCPTFYTTSTSENSFCHRDDTSDEERKREISEMKILQERLKNFTSENEKPGIINSDTCLEMWPPYSRDVSGNIALSKTGSVPSPSTNSEVRPLW